MKRILALTITTTLLFGCTVGPDYCSPEVTLPDNWSEELAPGISNEGESLGGWWQNFQDPELNLLMERAVACNLDLKLAGARLCQARALHWFTEADFGPTADVGGSFIREKISRNNFPFSEFRLPNDKSDLWQGSLDASWEIDIFGGKYRAMQATCRDFQALEYSRRDVLVSLLAEVALNYATLRSSQQEIAIINSQIASQEETLSISNSRVEQGATTELDVDRSNALLATLKSQIPPLEEQVHFSIHRLSVLVGASPGSLQCELLATTQPLPLISPIVPAGLPSTLLLRRPDIKEAERTYAAETARVGQIKADLYPKFFLTGSDGYISTGLGSLFTYPSQFWMIGPNVQWRIFDCGRIRSQICAQRAVQDQAFINYEKAILNALEEVENALIAYAKERERRNYLEEALIASQKSVELLNSRYEQGLGNYLDLLDAQRTFYSAQNDLIISEHAVTANLITLYKVLGGGWEVENVQ